MSIVLIDPGLTAAAVLFLFILSLPLAYLIGRKVLRRDMKALGSRLKTLARILNSLSDLVGRTVSWLALVMVLTQTIVVLQRYVFGIGLIWLQESVMYMYGLLFLLTAGYTLLNDGHVRVDIFYGKAKANTKAAINFVGTYLFLFPVMYLILDLGYPYFETSWRVMESSPETSGIPGIFGLKFAILVFAGLMIIQGLSHAIRDALTLADHSVLEAEPKNTLPSV